jgi:hypothetical protein
MGITTSESTRSNIAAPIRAAPHLLQPSSLAVVT